MALAPNTKAPQSPAYHLAPFASSYADLVATWCGEGIETMWLAPRTLPPITSAKVLGWKEEGRSPLVMISAGNDQPVAYGELNILRHRRREYWLGHLLVDPSQRGKGLGQMLVRLLIERAFRMLGACRVSLVVFPENQRAIAAYKKAGMRFDGYETHHFAPYSRRFELIRMDVRI